MSKTFKMTGNDVKTMKDVNSADESSFYWIPRLHINAGFDFDKN